MTVARFNKEDRRTPEQSGSRAKRPGECRKGPGGVLHVFLYVVESLEDPFEGLKNSITGHRFDLDEMVDIRLQPDEYNRVREVEYSARKYIRTVFYRQIFKSVESQIKAVATSVRESTPVIIYLSDEGVWAELVNQIINNIPRAIYTVNVQHGFFLLERQHLERQWAVYIRLLVNWVVIKIMGYPLFGMAFGRGKCDIYLCYGEEEKSFLTEEHNEIVYSAPRLIKRNLINRYIMAHERLGSTDGASAVLLAMPACVPGTEFRCDLKQFLEVVKPALTFLTGELGWRVIVRFHPGRDREECKRALMDAGMAALVEVDEERDVVDSMARCDVVMAAHSTVLFESGLLGKVPIAIRSDCFRRPLHYRHEVVDMSGDYRAQLAGALTDQIRSSYRTVADADELNWGGEIEGILGLVSGKAAVVSRGSWSE